MNPGGETYHVLKADKAKGIKLLYELYSKKLFAYATYNWKTEEDATWDLIYKTIYKVADVIHKYQFESEQKFTSFLFKTFINYLRNYIRDTKTASQGVVEVRFDDAITNDPNPAEGETTPSEELKVLQKELDKLQDWERILLLMRSQNISYYEISKFVDKPEDQLKVYYARLKKQITEKLNEQLNHLKPKENA